MSEYKNEVFEEFYKTLDRAEEGFVRCAGLLKMSDIEMFNVVDELNTFIANMKKRERHARLDNDNEELDRCLEELNCYTHDFIGKLFEMNIKVDEMIKSFSKNENSNYEKDAFNLLYKGLERNQHILFKNICTLGFLYTLRFVAELQLLKLDTKKRERHARKDNDIKELDRVLRSALFDWDRISGRLLLDVEKTAKAMRL